MPWIYVCEDCGQKMHPSKRIKKDKCRTCGNPVRPKYVCNNCGHLFFPEGEALGTKCPNCGTPVSEEKIEPSSYETVEMENGKLTVKSEDDDGTDLEAVEKVSLNVWGEEIGRIKNPEQAKFWTVDDYEETEDGVDLYFQPKEREELLEKIRKLRELKSTSDSE